MCGILGFQGGFGSLTGDLCNVAFQQTHILKGAFMKAFFDHVLNDFVWIIFIMISPLGALIYYPFFLLTSKLGDKRRDEDMGKGYNIGFDEGLEYGLEQGFDQGFEQGCKQRKTKDRKQIQVLRTQLDRLDDSYIYDDND